MAGSALVAAAWCVALQVHDVWGESTWEARLGEEHVPGVHPSWPAGYCVEASIGLRDELAERLPCCEPVYVWGEFGRRGATVGHAWVALGGREAVSRREAAYLDVTAGQFMAAAALGALERGEELALSLPGDPLYGFYHPKRVLDAEEYQGIAERAV